MTDLRERVAEEVRALLARRRLSARAAARELGWTANYLSRRMTGAAPFDVDDLGALARLLDVPVTTFFGDPEPAHSAHSGSDDKGFVNRHYRRSATPDLRRHDQRFGGGTRLVLAA